MNHIKKIPLYISSQAKNVVRRWAKQYLHISEVLDIIIAMNKREKSLSQDYSLLFLSLCFLCISMPQYHPFLINIFLSYICL